MKKSNTSERLQTIMHARKLKQVDILRLCEPYCLRYGVTIRKNDLSQYVNGKVEPGQFKLSVLAQALGVSETWLMGYEDESVNMSTLQEQPLSPDAIEIAQLYDQLDAGDRGEIRGTVKQMLKAPKYKKTATTA